MHGCPRHHEHVSQHRDSWARRQGVAIAGLMAIVVFCAVSSLGWSAAELAGLPPTLGWLGGAVAGYFLARAMLRLVLPRLLPPDR